MRSFVACSLILIASAAHANPPVASYVFPAGGQRGANVPIKLGGLFLHETCPAAIAGPGVTLSPTLKRTPTLWFEGPLLPLPDSQQAEDYPQDMAGEIAIAKDAPLGVRHVRVWTSQGVAPSVKFVVGNLPEMIEDEIDGDPTPVLAKTPVTINGRIFPREDIDLWSAQVKKGETLTCLVDAARLGSPLDARLEILDSQGRVLAENDDANGKDPAIRFAVPADGTYQVRIRDANLGGGQAYVYRLTIVTTPVVERVFPLGGQRGTKVTLEGAAAIDIPKDAPAAWQPADWTGSPVWLDIDDLPEIVEGRDVPKEPLTAPVVLNGRVARPDASSEFVLSFKKGESLALGLRAADLGSPLDAIATIVGPDGKDVLKIEGDKFAEWSAPTDGVYRVVVRDRFRSRGGPAFAYRLKIAPAQPGFSLTLPLDAATVVRKKDGNAKIKVNIARHGGFKDGLSLTAENLPDGVTAAPVVAAPGQASVELTLKADDTAPIAMREIRVIGTPVPPKETKKDAKDPPKDAPTLPAKTATVASARGEPVRDSVAVAVGLATPFTIKGEFDMGFAARGGMHRRSYKIERNGYAGPIEIRLAEKQARHLQGVVGPVIVVPAEKSEFTYEAYLPPWMELGRTCRVCVQGVGVLKDGDMEHKVVFSSTNQNEQLVAVVGPGHLAVELGRASVVARAKQSFEIPVTVKRNVGYRGPVTLSLVSPSHQKGVSADPTIVAADQERGVLTIRIGDNVPDFTMPLTIRAEMLHDGRRVVAEAPLDIR